jgi:hypothetical protein
LDSLEPQNNPESYSQGKGPATSLKHYLLLLMAVWTGVMALSLAGNLFQKRQEIIEIAQAEARGHINQIILYREWNALHGGVYVAVDEKTQPNPHLARNQERDLKTPSGRMLTLVNPAYLVRQLYELALGQNKVQGRIISLRPIRPEIPRIFGKPRPLMPWRKAPPKSARLNSCRTRITCV